MSKFADAEPVSAEEPSLVYAIEGLDGDTWQEVLRTGDTEVLRRNWLLRRDHHTASELRVLLYRKHAGEREHRRYLVDMFEADGRTPIGWSVRRTAVTLFTAAMMLAALNTPALTSWALGLEDGPAGDAALAASQFLNDQAERLGVGSVTRQARATADAVKGRRLPASGVGMAEGATRSDGSDPALQPGGPARLSDGSLPIAEAGASAPAEDGEPLAPIAIPTAGAVPSDEDGKPVLAMAPPSAAAAPAATVFPVSGKPAAPPPPKPSPPRARVEGAREGARTPAVQPQPAVGSAAAGQSRGTVLVFGDSLAQGLGPGLTRLLRADHFQVLNHGRVSTGLSRLDFFDWDQELERILRTERVDAAVVLLGANDPQGFVHEDRRRRDAFHTPAWNAAYARRVRETIGRFRSRGIPLVWVGLPVMRDEPYAQNVVFLNGIYRQAAVESGLSFIDLERLTADRNGRYSLYWEGPGERSWKLRSGDGIHFSPRGYEWIASQVLPALRPQLNRR
ncbi:DUF459 domain-containing protein [Azospirillum doebereinerae]|uniref:SGNH/GDSL hydrolase family protein n=1 Tax=Azospirillum doebereinerae TaxID=92933 RepID=UPI001EE6366D|nr:DUF459 domain-containing protein [Azospirillum doebereinerae]MCG5240337.1 DUF459 domain-containing protein [Azospirillum doebereinerae]